MAFESLTIAGKIWRSQGLARVFFPDGIPGVSHPEGVDDRTSGNLAQAGKRENRNAATVRNEVQSAPPAPVAPAAPSDKPRILPVEEWPVIWREQLRDTRKARLAWTYWNLGLDLLAIRGAMRETGEQQIRRKERLGFLRNLFRDLGFPPATHTFWPPHLDNSAQPEAQPELFWSGLRAIGCRGIVIMGSPAAKALLREAELKPLTQFMERGMLGWILWDIETFGRQAENYRRMVTFLRQSLMPFAPAT